MESDLHCIERGSLAYLIGDSPERYAVRIGKVFADASHVDGIGAGQIERLGVAERLGTVDEHHTFCSGECRAHFVQAQRTLCLGPYGFAVRAHHGHTDACSAHLKVGSMHYLLGLVVHFHLFLGVTVVGEYVDMRDEIVCQLTDEFLRLQFL